MRRRGEGGADGRRAALLVGAMGVPEPARMARPHTCGGHRRFAQDLYADGVTRLAVGLWEGVQPLDEGALDEDARRWLVRDATNAQASKPWKDTGREGTEGGGANVAAAEAASSRPLAQVMPLWRLLERIYAFHGMFVKTGHICIYHRTHDIGACARHALGHPRTHT